MPDSSASFHSVFDQVHDVAIFGAGYSGFAAARALIEEGRKVLLIDRRAALLVESGWSFASIAGDVNGILWRDWCDELKAAGAAENGRIDGAIAEVVATNWARQMRREGKLQTLYYAAPLALEGGDTMRGELLDAVLIGTKGGLRRVAAKQWIDATDSGELLQLFARAQKRDWQNPIRLMRLVNLYFRHAAWPDFPLGALENQPIAGVRLEWNRSLWPNERCLTLTVSGAGEEYGAMLRGLWIPALQALHAAFPDAMREAVLTHGSVEPLDIFSRVTQLQPVPPNVIAASPWMRRGTAESFLAGRFEIGAHAARRAFDLPRAAPQNRAFAGEIHWREESCEIAVAGAGTGGALAALAAARHGGAVLAFDPLPFCGGIGAGGGIHWYYFGVKGGLQEELDVRQRDVMPLFAPTGQIQGFHPDAKKCVLENMLRESGVNLMFGATLLDVQRDGQRVTHALLATPHGPIRLAAAAWIDSTGDGDLAARAGAGVRFGRDGDGLLHAYSQSSGRANLKNDKAFMQVINFDAGFVDPTDSEDLTRARIEGIGQYLQREYAEIERPTYIAPALGLRQSRHIITDYTLELSDLIERRAFADSVGLTGCHYDNHASDYEFESDEGLFWVWVCGQWRGRTGCEIPYRILLPQNLDNVWLACRALGVSQDAHHSLRMQRDMQRIGEVSGIAASLALQNNGSSRSVPFETLRAALESSGALEKQEAEGDTFGPDTKGDAVVTPASEDIAAWLDELRSAEAGVAPWRLYRAGQDDEMVRERVLTLLDEADEIASWRASAIGAMWNESRAEARLLREIEKRHAPNETKFTERSVPQWMMALSLLRRAGSPAALRLLDEVAGEANLVHNARTAIALAVEAIAARHALTSEEHQQVLEILWKLIEAPAPNAVAPMQRALTQTEFGGAGEAPTARAAVREDWTWQLHLAVARARHALGLPPHEQAVAFLADERALVRRAFTALCGEIATAV